MHKTGLLHAHLLDSNQPHEQNDSDYQLINFDNSELLKQIGCDLDLDFVLDERARELYWEGTRRTDLIRYGYFTTNAYLWTFKGGSQNGTSVSAYRGVFPLPEDVLSVNTNLKQNTGY